MRQYFSNIDLIAIFQKSSMILVILLASGHANALSESEALMMRISGIPLDSKDATKVDSKDATKAAIIASEVTQETANFIKYRASKFPKSPMLHDAALKLDAVGAALGAVKIRGITESYKTSIRDTWAPLQKNRQTIASQKFLAPKNAQAKSVFLFLVNSLQHVIVDILSQKSVDTQKEPEPKKPKRPLPKPPEPVVPARTKEVSGLGLKPIGGIRQPLPPKPILPLVPGLDFEQWLGRQNEEDRSRFSEIKRSPAGETAAFSTDEGRKAFADYQRANLVPVPPKPILPLVPGLDFEQWLGRQNEEDRSRFSEIKRSPAGETAAFSTDEGRKAFAEYQKAFPVVSKPKAPAPPGRGFEDWLDYQSQENKDKYATIEYNNKKPGEKTVTPTEEGRKVFEKYQAE